MDNKRQEILDTTIELIQKSGFDSFSYQDLSVAVGITKASIHYYFPSKEDLGLAVLNMIGQRAAMLMSMINKKDNAIEKLKLYFNAVLSSNGSDMICPVSSLQAEYNVIPESMKQELLRLSEAELNNLTSIVQQGLDEGSFTFIGTARDRATLMLTALKGSLQYSRAMQQDLRQPVVDLIWQEIRR